MIEPTLRKPAGALMVLALVILWVAAFASFSETFARLHPVLQLLVYLVAGIGWLWVLPMRPILRWMETGRWR